MNKYVFFDIDGTLNKTELYAVEAYQKALKKRGIEASREDIIACIGLTPEAIIKRFFGSLDEKELEEWRADIRTYEFAIMEKNAQPFEGIPEALKTLKDQGYKLGIASNAYPEHIEKVLKTLGIREYFDIIGSMEMGTTKVETVRSLIKDVNPSEACMVGDRKFDLSAAKENKIPVIGCAYGYAPEEIQEADIVIEHVAEMPEAVNHLLNR